MLQIFLTQRHQLCLLRFFFLSTLLFILSEDVYLLESLHTNEPDKQPVHFKLCSGLYVVVFQTQPEYDEHYIR